MKNLLLFLIPALFASTIVKAASLQPSKAKASGDSIGIVISDAKLSATQHGSVATAIKSMAGVNYIAYCSNHAVYILYVKSSTCKGKEAFLNTLIQNTGLTDLYLKNSDNPMQLLDNCKMDAATSESLKLRYGK